MLPKPQQTPWEEMAAEQPTADLSSAPVSTAGQGTTIGGKPSSSTSGAPAPAVAPPPALAMPTSDRCRACGAPLASDQRYCVECGERRGAARFALPTPGPAVDSAPSSRRVRRRPRMTPSATLIAGVATLLLAMGIGVLIGQVSNNGATPRAAAAPSVHVTFGGGAASTNAGATTSTTTSTPSTSSKSHKSSGKPKSATATTSVKTVQAAPPPTVTVGAKGSGAGYQNGHFTGNFFGNP
jgi:hypothetical protein